MTVEMTPARASLSNEPGTCQVAGQYIHTVRPLDRPETGDCVSASNKHKRFEAVLL
jgi:hypothetical protein